MTLNLDFQKIPWSPACFVVFCLFFRRTVSHVELYDLSSGTLLAFCKINKRIKGWLRSPKWFFSNSRKPSYSVLPWVFFNFSPHRYMFYEYNRPQSCSLELLSILGFFFFNIFLIRFVHGAYREAFVITLSSPPHLPPVTNYM